MSPGVAVIVVAAGSGSRLGVGAPKAFVTIGGRTILERALDEVFAMTGDPQVVGVVPGDRLDASRRMLAGTDAVVVTGGETRQRSVALGLAAVDSAVETVLVHDAARALTPVRLLESVAAEVVRSGHGVVPALPVVNTVARVDGVSDVAGYVDRDELREVQTPQGFPHAAFVAAHEKAAEDFTDDAALFRAAGHPVSVVDGDPLAFKITTSWDLRRAEQLVGAGDPDVALRTGIGVDIHAFDDARPLWLGGVYWPDEPGLAGHSDGDAVCHAVCDALLSAAGLGDVGGRFGTQEPRFADAAGSVFVAETVGLVTGAGFRILNVAVQLVANRPAVGPRRSELEGVLGDLVGAPVSVGATTSDGLGFTGAGEGVAVLATCLLGLRS
jgi:2-C-methyl-D-erythritol 4-phosphate cytidylyltransferase/2-C-methyl-D-erythritol 2,4-cyclodiphosphate synthase